MKLRDFNRRLIVLLAHDFEVTLAGCNQFITQRHIVTGDEAAIQQVNDGEQKDRLVRPLMRTALTATRRFLTNAVRVKAHSTGRE